MGRFLPGRGRLDRLLSCLCAVGAASADGALRRPARLVGLGRGRFRRSGAARPVGWSCGALRQSRKRMRWFPVVLAAGLVATRLERFHSRSEVTAGRPASGRLTRLSFQRFVRMRASAEETVVLCSGCRIGRRGRRRRDCDRAGNHSSGQMLTLARPSTASPRALIIAPTVSGIGVDRRKRAMLRRHVLLLARSSRWSLPRRVRSRPSCISEERAPTLSLSTPYGTQAGRSRSSRASDGGWGCQGETRHYRLLSLTVCMDDSRCSGAPTGSASPT